MRTPATRTSLREELRRLGLCAGDVVMVHAGLRSLGPVLGGVNTVVQALLDAVGDTGTLMAYMDWESGAGEEDFENESLREEIPTFDKRIARAARDHGPGSPLHKLVESGG